MTKSPPEESLEGIRRRIDAIDDALLDLMVERVSATEQVRASKRSAGTLSASPLRPAREAQMLRRLIARSNARISPEFLVRLWRVILSSSTQSQASVTLHMDRALTEDTGLQLQIGGHFCGMSVEAHGDVAASISALAKRRGDLAIVTTGSDWARHLIKQGADGARLIGALPVLGHGEAPDLLVIGHAEPQPSGNDETILLTTSALPKGTWPSPRWQKRSGNLLVTSLPGFLAQDSPVLASIMLGLADLSPFVTGRIPSSIENP